ncbi:MAG: SpoIIE family protein phosphatase [Bacteroidota bacterium]
MDLAFYKEQLQAKEDMLSSTSKYLMEIQHVLKEKNEEISEINEGIFESIQFAELIQKSLLPDVEVLKIFLKDASYKVIQQIGIGGDAVFIKNTSHGVLFGLFDATGHGIPAAMLSISGVLMLNELSSSVNVDSPKSLIKLLNYQLNNTFNNDHSVAHMEGSMFFFSSITKKLSYCSAKGKALYISLNKKIVELPYTKHSIGEDPTSDYEDFDLEFQKGDKLILYSDGLIDQFGGDLDKKFTRSRLKTILSDNLNKSAEDLKLVIVDEHMKWKNTRQQTDDLSFIIIEF